MTKLVLLTAILLASLPSIPALGDGSTTNGLTCAGFPGKYTYQRAKSVNYNQATGQASCDIVDVPTSSSKIAPLDNEMTHIFRGPLNLLQFAVYTQPSPSKLKMRRSPRASTHERRHGYTHQHLHQHAKEVRKEREKRYWVTATIDGQVQSWTQDYGEGAAPATPPPAPSPAAPALAPAAQSEESSSNTPASKNAPSPAPSVSVGAGDWARKAYFNADQQKAQGIAFTANNNMTIPKLGFLPGWVAPNAKDKAESSSILGKDGYIPDNYEILVHSDVRCNDPSMSACPVVTPGSIAHHGWGGDRIILAEFQMPHSSCTAASSATCKNQFTGSNGNPNQPAWWSLSTETINIAQYSFSFEPPTLYQGSPSCSGWLSGAGELDIHEIADPANLETGFTSFHMGQHYSGTPPQGWKRPSQGGSMKMAVITKGDSFRVQLLPDDMEFGTDLDDGTVEKWLGSGLGADIEKFAEATAEAPAKYAGSVADAPVFDVLLHS